MYCDGLGGDRRDQLIRLVSARIKCCTLGKEAGY